MGRDVGCAAMWTVEEASLARVVGMSKYENVFFMTAKPTGNVSTVHM